MSDWIKECVDSLKAALDEIASADCAPARGSAAPCESDTTLVRITLKGRRLKIIRTALWPGEWSSKLLPADEIEKAFREGSKAEYDSYLKGSIKTSDEQWLSSGAYKIVKGEEV